MRSEAEAGRNSASLISFQNPVWPGYFADPFVLRCRDAYYAYGTGATPLEADGRAFPVLRSTDLRKWEYVGGAMQAIPGATAYWAPEVAHKDGKFYLYYSAAFGGGDETHALRVAIADSPAGPFVDSGKPILPEQGFCIDPHPFCDPQTGKWYLYFATDYTSDEPHGTGLAVVPLRDDLVATDGNVVAGIRASQDWQIYEKDRNYKGRVWPRWYTVEGPFVLYHEDRYWCLYSGGRWSSADYGIGFAVAEHPLGPFRDDMAVHGPVVLKGVPGKLIGPGHNSTTVSPDGKTQLIVYHAWNTERTMRQMCIDRLIWTADGPRCRRE